MKQNTRVFIIFNFFLIADQVTKHIATQYGWVTYNTGFAFGMGEGFGANILLQVVSFFILVYALVSLSMKMELIALILAGVVGNTVDRLLLQGGVRDWIYIPFLDVHNNLADFYIFFAILIFVLQYLYDYRNNLRR